MPCRTFDDGHNWNHQDDTKPLKDRINLLEAILCAIFNELEAMDMAEAVITKAQINGGLENDEIEAFWLEHKKEDKERLANELVDFLNGYSHHEQEMIVDIIKKRT